MKSFNYHIKNKTIEDITQKCLFHSSDNSQYPSAVSETNYWSNSLPPMSISIIFKPQINPFTSYSTLKSSQHDFKICWNHHKNSSSPLFRHQFFDRTNAISYGQTSRNIPTQSPLQNEILRLFPSTSTTSCLWNTSIISIYKVINTKNHQRLLQSVSSSQVYFIQLVCLLSL